MISTTLLAIVAGLAFSLSHFMVRLGLGASNPTTAVTVNVTVNALGVWAVAILFTPLQPLWSPAIWPYAVGGLFAPSLARILLYRGYRHLGLARTSVLAGGVPLFSVGIAILFLGERPSWTIIVGTLGIVAGVGVLSSSRAGREPWARWTLVLPMGAAICFALRDIFSKLGLVYVPFPVGGAAVASTTAALGLYLSLLLPVEQDRLVFERRSFWLFVGSGLILVVSYVCVFYALQQGTVSEVSPIVNVHPLYSVALSYLFLQSSERVNARVVLGGVLVVGGAAAVFLG